MDGHPKTETSRRPLRRDDSIRRSELSARSVKVGSSTSLRKIIEMACFRASLGPPSTHRFPWSRSPPASESVAPVRIFIRVDLPARFSPIRAWRLPVGNNRPTPRSAWTPPNRFEIPIISTASSDCLPSEASLISRNAPWVMSSLKKGDAGPVRPRPRGGTRHADLATPPSGPRRHRRTGSG